MGGGVCYFYHVRLSSFSHHFEQYSVLKKWKTTNFNTRHSQPFQFWEQEWWKELENWCQKNYIFKMYFTIWSLPFKFETVNLFIRSYVHLDKYLYGVWLEQNYRTPCMHRYLLYRKRSILYVVGMRWANERLSLQRAWYKVKILRLLYSSSMVGKFSHRERILERIVILLYCSLFS